MIAATVAVIGNGVIGAVELVVNAINTMVNSAIYALNLLSPFKDIDQVPMMNMPRIPVPNFGSGTLNTPSGSGIFAPPNPPKSGGTMPGVSIPAMPELIPAIGGGGGGSTSQGPSFAPVNGPIGYVGGIQERIANRPDVTINVSGGISSAVDIGQSVLDALTQYTQVYGPLNLAIR